LIKSYHARASLALALLTGFLAEVSLRVCLCCCCCRLQVAPAAGTTRSIFYSLQSNVSSGCYSPRQLLKLLLLLRHWRPAGQSAAALKASLIEAVLVMTQRQMYEQIKMRLQQQLLLLLQQGAADASEASEHQLLQQQDVTEPSGSSTRSAAAAAAAQQFDADVASMLLLVLARLRIRPKEPWMQLHSRLLLQLLPDLSTLQVSRVLLAFAGLEYTPEAAVAGQLLQRTQQLLPEMLSCELVTTMHALGKLRVSPSEAWLAVFYAAVQAAPDSLQVSGFGMVVWGLAKLGAKPPQVWMEQLMNSTFADVHSSSSSGAAVTMAAGRLKPQHLANLLCAFAKLGFVPGVQWMSWFRAQLGQAGALQDLDHFHIEWAWRELHEQYRAAATATDPAAAADADANSADAATTAGGLAAGDSSG
jgi:hypothetical protein